MAPLAPVRLVPCLRVPPDGLVISESLAIAEMLAERHPETDIWPADTTVRAVARWLCAEMATGFLNLRNQCPMQLHCVWERFLPSQDVRDDLARLETPWNHARKVSEARSGWLFGIRSAADAFFVPVAARIAGYDLARIRQCPCLLRPFFFYSAVRQWRADALEEIHDPMPHDQTLPRQP